MYLVADDLEQERQAPFRECNICMQNFTDCVVLECGHIFGCGECISKLSICAMCRLPIAKSVKIFKC